MTTNDSIAVPDRADSSDRPDPADRFDSPWKDAIEHAFPEFLAFYFPAAHRHIDWTRGHDFLDKELRRILRDADSGDRHADKLVRVHRLRGDEDWVYVHIEVQAARKSDFALRMFTSSYRLFDRFGRPVASLAILADSRRGWRPDGYGFELFGCRHWLTFPVVKLLDRAGELDALLVDPNPFALVTAAHLLTRSTRGSAARRFEAKRRLVRLLYERNWTRERIIGLFGVLDWMLALPGALEDRPWQDIEMLEGTRNMRYITSVERIGLRKGFEKGHEAGREAGRSEILLEQLAHRFGPLSDAIVARIKSGSATDVDRWARRVLDARTLDEVFSEAS
ncbi:MAG TPA: transposase [Burkholderiaceae bacterium]|nr:transposase [Burkholderiaceae bacterium]